MTIDKGVSVASLSTSPGAAIRRLLERSGLLIRIKNIYYPAETRIHLRRAKAFFGRVCGPGALVFDVGANLGQRTEVFLRLGARVLAIEPERRCYEYVQKRFQRFDQLTALNVAVSDRPGQLRLFVNPQTPEISSLDVAWLTNGPNRKKAGVFEEQLVNVVTLSDLIERYGRPDYVKIDVEGFETHVLRGLTVPVRHLSFEFHTDNVGGLIECCGLLLNLAPYAFNYTLANSCVLALSSWVSGGALAEAIRSLPLTRAGAPQSGDVFARLETSSDDA